MGDSVPKHTGPISLTDTPLEPSISRTRPPIIRGNSRDGKLSSAERLNLLAEAIVWGRNSLLSSGGESIAIAARHRYHCTYLRKGSCHGTSQSSTRCKNYSGSTFHSEIHQALRESWL